MRDLSLVRFLLFISIGKKTNINLYNFDILKKLVAAHKMLQGISCF